MTVASVGITVSARKSDPNNAEQAVELYNSTRPDAVIMDVIMPGSMDGLGALAAFKKIDREVPVIVISGQGRTATVVQAMKLGAFDFIGKPFDEADLEALLADALRQRRFNRDVSMVRNGLQHPNTHPMVFGDSVDGAAVSITLRDQRCVMINFDPDTAQQDPAVMKAVVRMNQNTAGVYGTVVQEGPLTVGQRVFLISESAR